LTTSGRERLLAARKAKVAKRHIVQQGECMVKIALLHGFHSHRVVYDHPDNAELREKRPNPHLLFPGDVVIIPDRTLKDLEAAAGRVHRFVVKQPARVLRVRFQRPKGEPLAGEPYTLRFDTRRTVEGQTTGDGFLEEQVLPDESGAVLRIEQRVVALRLGHLSPVGDVENDDLSGIQARLQNLGYEIGPLDGRYGRRTRAALALLQAVEGLEVDGLPNEETLAKLEELHGC
jgi:hypothetical protein